ncbi:MAG: ATP-binding protein [Lachnospiraceae bacterium]|nr:ATP-binding protein [Lachnospiraceae bacterium]
MYRYKIYGILIESEFELKLLVPAEETDKLSDVITVREKDVEEEVLNYLKEAGALKKHYEIGLEKSAMENIGGYYLVTDSQILVKLKEGYTYDTISSWILGYCLSMALLQKNILTIHCSAITNNAGAVLVSGTPGAGKSSLAGKLLEHGYKLLADDVAAIRFKDDKCLVYPAYPFQKLCSNEVENRALDKSKLVYINEDKDKYLVPVNDIFEPAPHQLKAFFYIIKAPVEELTLKKLSGFECFMSVKENLFLHRLKGNWETTPEVISQCMKIASGCDVYLLVRPDNKDTLTEINQTVLKLLQYPL